MAQNFGKLMLGLEPTRIHQNPAGIKKVHKAPCETVNNTAICVSAERQTQTKLSQGKEDKDTPPFRLNFLAKNNNFSGKASRHQTHQSGV